MSTVAGSRVEELAQDLFEVLTHLSLSTQSHQRRGVALKEFEFLTLTLLQTQQTMIVGDIQRVLGILPAQMSRIIRSLENRSDPLIECQINPTDKRKINVSLTPAGRRALDKYQDLRVRKLTKLLGDVTEDDQEELFHLTQKLHVLLARHTLDLPEQEFSPC